MPEHETIALEQDLAWREKAMWLLLRRAGGRVKVTAEEWASVPPLPELVIGREGDVMVWMAREPEQALPVAAESPEPEKASDFMPGFITAADPASSSDIDVPLPFPEEP